MPIKTSAADLAEMLSAIDRIEAYAAGMDGAAFARSPITYDAALMNLIVIGEAANRLPAVVTDAEPSVPWPAVVAMRNRIAHGYGAIEPERIWATITSNLPTLRAAVQRLLDAADAAAAAELQEIEDNGA